MIRIEKIIASLSPNPFASTDLIQTNQIPFCNFGIGPERPPQLLR